MARKFGEFHCYERLARKVWQIDRFSHKVIIICKNLDGFSLANHGRFAKFVKLSRYTVFDKFICIWLT